jgi:hypothetical protein
MAAPVDHDREHPAVVILSAIVCIAAIVLWWTITPP